MTVKTLLISIGLVTGLCACTTSDNKPTPLISDTLLESTNQDGRACVREYDIQGYGVLDDDVISINGRSNYYLATVLPGCNSLSTSARAHFEEHFNEICGGGVSKVYAGGDQCTIRHLFEFEDRDAAFEAYHNAMELRENGSSEASE